MRSVLKLLLVALGVPAVVWLIFSWFEAGKEIRSPTEGRLSMQSTKYACGPQLAGTARALLDSKLCRQRAHHLGGSE